MADNSDDPFAPQDGTIIRPRPGAGRRGGNAPDTAGVTAAAAAAPPPLQSSRAASFSSPPLQGGGGSGVGALSDFIGTSGNPILQAAAPLLILAAKLQTSVQQANIATLRQQAVHEVRSMED